MFTFTGLSNDEVARMANPNSNAVSIALDQAQAARLELERRERERQVHEKARQEALETEANDPGVLYSGQRQAEYADTVLAGPINEAIRAVRVSTGKPPKALVVFLQIVFFLLRTDRWRVAVQAIAHNNLLDDFEFNCEATHRRRHLSEVFLSWFSGGDRSAIMRKLTQDQQQRWGQMWYGVRHHGG